MAAAAIAIGSAIAAEAAVSALVLTGLQATLVGAAISFGVSTLAGSLLGVNDQPENDFSALQNSLDRQRGLLVNTASNVEKIDVAYGTVRKGGARFVGPHVSGSSNWYMHLAVAWSEGPIEAIDAMYFDDTLSTDTKFGNAVIEEEHVLGEIGQAANATMLTELGGSDELDWSSDHRVDGTAYSYVKLAFKSPGASNRDRAPWGGIPTITVDVRGRKVYDPRDESTAFSNNPALCIRDYLTNDIYGVGIEETKIDDTSFITAANYCDESVSVPDGSGGTTTQARYTLDGVVQTGNRVFDNVARMLDSCRGMLVFAGGYYKLIIDKPETPVFTFDEDNMVGPWQIPTAELKSTFNRVLAAFPDPDLEWQTNLATSDSPTFRSVDGGEVRERSVRLDYTTDLYRAEQIAGLILRQSRQGIVASFRATQQALKCSVGDVVYMTSTMPGWVQKKFRVIKMDILREFEVGVMAVEYDDSVYTLGSLDDKDSRPNTNLPSFTDVAAPGIPTVVEEAYQTTAGTGIKTKAVMSWTAAPDQFVVEYVPYYRVQGAGDDGWVALTPTPGLTSEVLDIDPGFYDFAVVAYNGAGAASSFSVKLGVEMVGLAAAPGDVSGLQIQVLGGQAMLSWDLAADADVINGGRVIFRHAQAQSGAQWVDGVSIGPLGTGHVDGHSTIAWLPAKPGTYMAKFEDSSGQESATEASVSTSAANIHSFTTSGTLSEHPSFTGTHTNTAVVDSLLKLEGSQNIDDWDYDGDETVLGSIDTDGTAGTAAIFMQSAGGWSADFPYADILDSADGFAYVTRIRLKTHKDPGLFGMFAQSSTQANVGTFHRFWFGQVNSSNGLVAYVRQLGGTYVAVSAGFIPDLDRWYTFAVRHTAAHYTSIYIDGVERGSVYTGVPDSAIASVAYQSGGIGNAGWSTGQEFQLGETAWFDKDPGDSFLQAITTVGAGNDGVPPLFDGTEDGLRIHWKLDEGTGYTAADSSGNGDDAYAYVTGNPSATADWVNDTMDVDDVGAWDAQGGVSASGIYEFSAPVDLGSVTKVKIETVITSLVVNVNDLVDDRTDSIDDWVDFDGTTGSEADMCIDVAETDDDPSGSPVWGAWNQLHSGEYEARAFKFRAQLKSYDPQYNIHVTELTVNINEVV